MEENGDSDLNNQGDENLPQEQENSKESNKSSLNESIRKRISKSSKLNAAKKSLVKALMPIITYVLVFVIILIIIIGIILFFITMPGMVMDKLKELARAAGEAVTSWFGGDDTKNVDIYETLNYLEEMGYDLKSDGFLTDYVGDADDGVERDDDGNITKAESDFIKAYLISDNYVYTIKNFNVTNEDGNWHIVPGLAKKLASLFTLGSSNQYWSRGMIELRHDGGTLGHEGKYYSSYEMGSISVDVEAKTLEIKRGWFNNSMKYNLDGWTGRYGMPVDFLLSVHLATMMPDLSYDMATSFTTVIEILLHGIGGVFDEGDGTAVGYYKVGDNYVSYDDFAAIAESTIFDTWRISRKEAMDFFREYNSGGTEKIKSPSNCTGVTETSKVVESDENRQTSISSSGTAHVSDFTESFNKMVDTLNTYNFPGFLPEKLNEDANLNHTDEVEKDIQNFFNNTQETDNLNENVDYRAKVTKNVESTESDDQLHIIKTSTMQFTYNWTGKNDEGEDCPFVCTGTFKMEIPELKEEYQGSIDNSERKYYIDWKVTQNWSQGEYDRWKEEHPDESIEEGRCSLHYNDKTETCENCRKYLQSIYDHVKKVDVSDLDIFVPYIAYVKDHWYRDVYFVANGDKEFVDYDYDYEAIMKERWTRYETDDEGNYVYYKLNPDGTYGERYTGLVTSGETTTTNADGDKENIRISSIGENGEKVVKKPVTNQISSKADDLNWNLEDGVYTAYEVQDSGDTQSNFQAVYPDVDDDDEDADIKRNLYVDIQTSGNISQTGEGQRTETNSKIKQMFLENTYFRYDKSPETAEIINKIRKNYNLGYGPITNEDILKEYVNSKGETVAEPDDESDDARQIKEFTGQVSLEQDALNEFSMLENTHTLDSDYIYRDFKELLVEFGYYEKEELTDETPRIMQWLVPDVGSFGYPNRAIDKNEHEYGTMVHSEGDIKVSQNNTLRALAEQEAKEDKPKSDAELGESSKDTSVKEDKNKDKDTDKDKDKNKDKTSSVSKLNSYAINENQEIFSQIASVSHTMSPNLFNEVGAATQFKQDTLIDTAKACWEYIVDNGTKYSYGGASIPVSNGSTVDCSSYVSWVLYEYGFEGFEGGQKTTDTFLNTNWNEMFGWEEIPVGSGENPYDILEPGDIFVRHGGGTHHVTFVVEKEDGSIFCYDCGNEKNWRSPVTRDAGPMYNCTYFLTESGEGKIIRIENAKTSSGEEYKGYEGNEEVVSPVTGILLEYGTYTDEDENSISGEKDRVNTDLKYGTNGILASVRNTDESSQSTDEPGQNTEETQGKEVVDKVGYAKILVLDKEHFAKLEAALKSKSDFDENLLSKKGNYKDYNLTEEQVKDWSDAKKTLYGYKEFAELYEEYDIEGSTIIIDGFKCEFKDEEFGSDESDSESSDTSSSSKEKPKGDEIKTSNFENITKASFDEEGNLISSEELHPSLYEQDDKVKMASNSATEKRNTESAIKNDAVSTIKVGDDIFIKEGTVLGRTLTDREVVEDYGDGARGEYSDYRKDGNQTDTSSDSSDDTEKIVGNYLRMIMTDRDTAVVENIEDYMKLDDGSEPKQQYENFSVVGTVIPIEEWVELAYAYTSTHGCAAKFQDKDNLREWYNLNVEKGVNPEYTFVRGIEESGLSDGSADSAGTNYWGYGTPNGSTSVASYGSWQECLGKYCDTIVEYQDPSTWQYQEIMKRCHERESCTENGGIDPLGYGDPKTVGGQQCLYSWLGDNHLANSAGDGGMYYLYPWGWGGTQYEGENKIIFESKAEFEQLCGSKHGTSGGSTSSTATTVWEQGMYTAWQSRKVVSLAKEIFGERAGTYVG